MNTPGPVGVQLPRPGDTIAGKYVLERLLGQGGMGAVFAAKHVKLSKQVAIKIMLADTSNPEAATRFLNEGRAAANIQNEHVVRVDDVDEEMGYAYMVLELLDGEDLAQVLEREPQHRLPPHVAVGYVLQALHGVAQAHAIGIVHRDLKPSNLFLAKRKDGSLVVKVLDFGISKAQGSSALAASPNALTSTKAMLGSPLYMSPEQLRSSKSVDHRADIWAIGVILYELITGGLPFMGDNLGELFAAILETDPTPLRQRVDGVHPRLEEIVLRCLARRPESRFQSVAELIGALTPLATAQPVPTTTPGSAPSPPNLPQSGMHAPHIVTGGAQPRVVGGTVALGASTPVGFQQTNGGGWQSTGTNGVAPSKSKAPLIIGVIAGFVVVAVMTVGVVLLVRPKAKLDPTPASTSIVSAAPPPAASSPPAASHAASSAEAFSDTAVTPPTAPSTSVTPAAASTSPAVKTVHGGHAAPPPPPPVKQTETKAPETKPPATSKPKSGSDGLQTGR